MSTPTYSAHAATDVGLVREGNEDSFFKGSTVFAVADGMGGHQAGEVASSAAVKPLEEVDGREYATAEEATQALELALRRANGNVVSQAEANPAWRGMGTTLTAVLMRQGRLHVAHVGDSRAYLLRGRDISQLTTDHTLVERLVQEGRLSRDEADTHPQRSVITRAIGIETDLQVDTLPPLAMQPGDQVLLCSDGLSGPVKDTEIAAILEGVTDGDDACAALLDAANARGGPDNITVVLLKVRGGAPPVAATNHASPGVLADDATGELAPAGLGGGTVTRIRTDSAPQADWATSMHRYAQPRSTPEPAEPGVRVRRILAGLLGLLVLAGVLVGGGWLVLSRAYFVGDDGGTVAIFNGLPQQLAGLELSRVLERSDLRTAELAPLRQRRVAGGVSAASLAEAREIVAAMRTGARRSRPARAPTPEPTPTPTPSALPDGRASPSPTASSPDNAP